MDITSSLSSCDSRHKNTRIHVGLIIALAVITRALYLNSPAGRIGYGDEAVFGMMAQKIAALKEFPLFCWKAEYAGALVSYIAAVIFQFFGSGFVQLRCAMLPFAVGTPLLFYFIYRRIAGPLESLLGSLLLVACPFLVLRFTTSALGGYGETFFGTGLIILLSWKIIEDPKKSGHQFFRLGLVSGFFFYILFLIAPAIAAFAFPALLFHKRNRFKNSMLFTCGGIIGMMPMIVHNIINGGGTIIRSAGRSTSIGPNDLNSSTLELIRIIVENKLSYFKMWFAEAPSLFGQYILPENAGHFSLQTIGVLLMIFLVLFITRVFLVTKRNVGKIYVLHFSFYFIFLVIFSWIANLNRARHLLPLLLIIPVAFFSTAEVKNRSIGKKILPGVFILLYTLNLLSWVSGFKTSNFNPAAVLGSFTNNNVRYFYGSYLTTFPIMFISKGTVVGSPMLLPNHEILSDRRPDFSEAVRKAPAPAFFFAKTETSLEKEFQAFLLISHITSSCDRNVDGALFFNLSKPVDAVVKTKWNTTFMLRENNLP
jgi:hypothetical protein